MVAKSPLFIRLLVFIFDTLLTNPNKFCMNSVILKILYSLKIIVTIIR